jgi:hypothetical protein
MDRLKVLNDFAFQKAFGEKGDEPQLLAFLNAALERTGKGKEVRRFHRLTLIFGAKYLFNL